MHLGEEDEFISKAAQAEIKAGARKKAKCDRLQLSGSASRHSPAQWVALRRRGSGASERANF
jgi:hypothetical protein